MSIFAWLVLACWIIFMIVWLVTAPSAKKNSKTASMHGIGMRLLLVLALLVLINAPQATSVVSTMSAKFTDPVINSIGVALCAAGIAFAFWARVHIGSNWGMPMSVKESPALVTSGPYAYVRHPIYTGVILAMLGSGLVTGLWWLVILVIFSGYFIYSAIQEEKLLMKEFPNEYPAYKERTKMLVPFIF